MIQIWWKHYKITFFNFRSVMSSVSTICKINRMISYINIWVFKYCWFMSTRWMGLLNSLFSKLSRIFSLNFENSCTGHGPLFWDQSVATFHLANLRVSTKHRLCWSIVLNFMWVCFGTSSRWHRIQWPDMPIEQLIFIKTPPPWIRESISSLPLDSAVILNIWRSVGWTMPSFRFMALSEKEIDVKFLSLQARFMKSAIIFISASSGILLIY
jgi:hypothetical protein